MEQSFGGIPGTMQISDSQINQQIKPRKYRPREQVSSPSEFNGKSGRDKVFEFTKFLDDFAKKG